MHASHAARCVACHGVRSPWRRNEPMLAVTVNVVPDCYPGFVKPRRLSESGSGAVEAGEGTIGVDKSMTEVVIGPEGGTAFAASAFGS